MVLTSYSIGTPISVDDVSLQSLPKSTVILTGAECGASVGAVCRRLGDAVHVCASRRRHGSRPPRGTVALGIRDGTLSNTRKTLQLMTEEAASGFINAYHNLYNQTLHREMVELRRNRREFEETAEDIAE